MPDTQLDTLTPDATARLVAQKCLEAGATALEMFADAVEAIRPPRGKRPACRAAEEMRRNILREARGLAAGWRASAGAGSGPETVGL